MRSRDSDAGLDGQSLAFCHHRPFPIKFARLFARLSPVKSLRQTFFRFAPLQTFVSHITSSSSSPQLLHSLYLIIRHSVSHTLFSHSNHRLHIHSHNHVLRQRLRWWRWRRLRRRPLLRKWRWLQQWVRPSHLKHSDFIKFANRDV